MSQLNNYNKRYQEKEFYWDEKPHGLVTKAIENLPIHAKVLNLGCGEGQNSIYLAQNKFDVTAIDIAKTGIFKLNKLAKIQNLKIKTKTSDATTFLNDCDKFEAIFCINILQFIDQKNINSIIQKIKHTTSLNGFNIIVSTIAMNNKHQDLITKGNRYFFQTNELKDIYKDWKIIFYNERLSDWETYGEPKHRHKFALLITQKKLVE